MNAHLARTGRPCWPFPVRGRVGRTTVWAILLWSAVTALSGSARATEIGSAEIHFRGLADLALSGPAESIEWNWLNRGDSAFDPYRLRLFAEGTAPGGFSLFSQLMLTEATEISVYGAYVVYAPISGRDFNLTAGKIPWLIGTYAPRGYSDKNPLIGSPLMHQHHTTLRPDVPPPNADALLAAAGTGQYGVDYGAGKGWRGMPIVYDRCWDFGVMLSGSARPFEGTIGIVNGTPGMSVPGVDWNDGKSVLGRLGYTPWPVLRVGVSGSYGPYMPEWAYGLPPGSNVEDYNQRLILTDLEIMAGHLEVHAEGHLNTWETATVGDLDANGGYLEAKMTVAPGAYVAGRFSAMRFSQLADSLGQEHSWDHDIDRIEAGGGYRVSRNALVKVVFQRTTVHEPGEYDHYDLYGAQLSLSF